MLTQFVLRKTFLLFTIVWQKSRQSRRLRYREMITDFLWPEIEDMDLDDMWFQKDGATCHTANETMTLLREKFNGRVMSWRC